MTTTTTTDRTDTTPEIKVGSTVRSFDFARSGDRMGRDLMGERACYVIGVVESIGRRPEASLGGCDRYEIRVVARVWGGEVAVPPQGDVPRDHAVLAPQYVYPPVNGTPKMGGDVCDSVELA